MADKKKNVLNFYDPRYVPPPVLPIYGDNVWETSNNQNYPTVNFDKAGRTGSDVQRYNPQTVKAMGENDNSMLASWLLGKQANVISPDFGLGVLRDPSLYSDPKFRAYPSEYAAFEGVKPSYAALLDASNRSALVKLGLAPANIAITPIPLSGGAGRYSGNKDAGWAMGIPEDVSGLSHETIHRGIKKLLESNTLSNEDKNWLLKRENNELATRWMTRHVVGFDEVSQEAKNLLPEDTMNLAKGIASINKNEHNRQYMDQLLGLNKGAADDPETLDRLLRIERMAQNLVSQTKPSGPR